MDRNAADDPGSKVNQAVKDIVAGYKESADRNGVTLVFADRFAPMRLKSVIEFLKAHGDFLGKAWAERLEAELKAQADAAAAAAAAEDAAAAEAAEGEGGEGAAEAGGESSEE